MPTTRFDLAGRCALVTGGSRGLGKCMARAFAEAGADVMITSRHEDELKTAAASIGDGLPRRVEWAVVDLTRADEAEALARTAVARLGKVDILVNNAGTNLPQPIDQLKDDAWQTMLELNLNSAMRLTRALVPGMKERRWGRVIHISSVLGLGGKEGRNGYCATKAAVIGLAQASSLDLGPFGVTVNCIAPGPFLTDLPGKLLNDEQKKHFSDRTALGRWGRPEEIMGPALLLASDAGSFITGSTLVVDGGCTIRIL
ncbi:MAG TPA: SDR family NAD(P)-dependent oxidoreductase [Planctomycetota bacterium]|nr:SDR family NAD(P)-dependent oxidoreductase [Planctomycetota bacterium]